MNERIKFYLENINTMLSSDPEYKEIIEDVEEGKNSFRIIQKRSQKTIDMTWVERIEAVLPNLDTIIRNPRRFIVIEEDIIDVSLARSVSKESVKHLATHTGLISAVEGDRIIPSKILNVQKEESIEIYENRFIYTLIDMLARFIAKQEEALKNLKNSNSKKLQYEASTVINGERVKIELNIDSKEETKVDNDKDTQEKLKEIRERIKLIKQYLTYWNRSDLIKGLVSARASFVVPPIKKTNLILKNPNFQVATRLWEFLYAYGMNLDEDEKKDGLDTSGTNTIKEILDDSFLMQYFVLDSISQSKREQKEKLSKYAVVMLKQQVQRSISLLLNCGIKITDEELLEMIADEIKKEKTKKTVGKEDIKKKFMSVMDEYLENTQSYL